VAHPIRSAWRWRPLRFVLVGAFGFLIDAGVLHMLVFVWQANLFAARVVSFLAAVLATWLANRTLTFEAHSSSWRALPVEWFRYLLSSIAGGVVNYAAFVISVEMYTSIRNNPAIGVAIGSIAGLCVNYLLYAQFVFASRHGT
jgi:putative flippase GtrA